MNKNRIVKLNCHIRDHMLILMYTTFISVMATWMSLRTEEFSVWLLVGVAWGLSAGQAITCLWAWLTMKSEDRITDGKLN